MEEKDCQICRDIAERFYIIESFGEMIPLNLLTMRMVHQIGHFEQAVEEATKSMKELAEKLKE